MKLCHGNKRFWRWQGMVMIVPLLLILFVWVTDAQSQNPATLSSISEEKIQITIERIVTKYFDGKKDLFQLEIKKYFQQPENKKELQKIAHEEAKNMVIAENELQKIAREEGEQEAKDMVGKLIGNLGTFATVLSVLVTVFTGIGIVLSVYMFFLKESIKKYVFNEVFKEIGQDMRELKNKLSENNKFIDTKKEEIKNYVESFKNEIDELQRQYEKLIENQSRE